ncbi:hypothetical protein A3Q56_04625 [Intoshia linei]|uniref:ADF-H domain-containing protein n=1 Tax=Intoshia linei TaxID=1819745 RepID=A0A177B213_9BILA|nr:hypothetical protein A3Q56_04625 [Intoshia linei]
MISGFDIGQEILESIQKVYRKKLRYVILRFDDKYQNLLLIKTAKYEKFDKSTFSEIVDYYTSQCPKSFLYSFFHFEYNNKSGHFRNRVACLKIGIPERAEIREKMIYASSYKHLQQVTKCNTYIDCTDISSLEYDNIVEMLIEKCEKYE